MLTHDNTIRFMRQFQDYLFGKYGEMPESADEINMMREKRDAEITE